MDILNFISWIRGRRQVTSVDPAKTLLPVALKDSRRDDEYLTGAISVEDLAAQIAPQPVYKVYTALLTQSGGDNPQSISSGAVTKGVTYFIDGAGATSDFSNVGGPAIGTNSQYFVASNSDVPNNYDGGSLLYNTGAPVATVLENTIGNITWNYFEPGKSGGTFPSVPNWNKVAVFIGQKSTFNIFYVLNSDYNIIVGDFTNGDQLNNTPIEIRVYN